MVAFRIALRSLLRRKVRMALIGLLVVLGTILIVFGETFSLSAQHFSQQAIVNYFTGDVIIYSARSKEKPSPFSFTTPLPILSHPQDIEKWLAGNALVSQYVAIGQNYGLLSVERKGKTYDVPFFFYAVDPLKYRKTFANISMQKGSFFNTDTSLQGEENFEPGVVLSSFQVKNYATNYNVEFQPGDVVRLLSISEGGSVNAVTSKIAGVYEPLHFKNVFNYINFLDIKSYAQLYSFTGVDSASLPGTFNAALASTSDDDIFGLAEGSLENLETDSLVARELTGYMMIAVKLKSTASISAFTVELATTGFDVKSATWNEASGFFAYIANIIQAVIYGATLLIFLIVVFILMNTIIINVLERTSEIGTLRALGAEKRFITTLFLWESFLLNGCSAILGMIVSIVLILALKQGILLPEVMQQYLIGGGPLPLLLSVRPFIEAALLVCAVSVLAIIYPLRVATAITPLKAMSGK